jgi:uncharacterized protein (TIGR03435 family)
MRTLIGTLLVLSAVPGARAQQPASPAFDVASVKRSPAPGGPNGPIAISMVGPRNGQFVATNMAVRALVAYAFSVPIARVVGGPGWIDSDRYEITARPPQSSPPTQNARMEGLLRALLLERFALATHTEMRQASIYTLVRGRADRLGPQLAPSALDCASGGPPFIPPRPGSASAEPPLRCNMTIGSDGKTTTMRGAVSVQDFARTLTSRLGAPVTDATGLTGRYNLTLRFATGDVTTTEPSEWPLLPDAIREQLGLKLETSRASLDFIVIDRIEQPTEN